jgi:hypothetical protein
VFEWGYLRHGPAFSQIGKPGEKENFLIYPLPHRRKHAVLTDKRIGVNDLGFALQHRFHAALPVFDFQIVGVQPQIKN